MWTPLIIISLVLIGLSAYYYYYYCRKIEKFAEAAAAPVNIQDAVDGLTQLLTEVGSGNIPEGTPYVETLANIPSQSDLKLYLTSFSARTHYDNSVKVYLPEMQRWYNFVKANQSFFVKGAPNDISASIRESGMKLKKVALEGLRSDEINMTDYSLKSFSATFFMTFANTATVGASPTFTVPENCELFTISLEAPNFVKLLLIDNTTDSSKCKFVLQVGTDANIISTADIAKSDLISGSPVSITISCEITPPNKVTLNIYVGKYLTDRYSDVVTPPTDEVSYNATSQFVLGNSRMSINKNQKELDANLLAFMFFSKPFNSDAQNSITRYLAEQNKPQTGLLSTLNTAATSQLETIRRLITDNTATQGTLQQQLNACRATVVKKPVVKAFGHLINMDGISDSDVTSEDLRSCSILEVKKRLTKAVASASATTATGGPRFQINMPQGSSSNVTPVPPS